MTRLLLLVLVLLTEATAAEVSVSTYGAVGDGTSDSTTAIANAIAALPGAGGIVTFPAGTYLVRPAGGGDPLRPGVTIRSGITLRGAGRDLTTLKVANAIGAYAAVIGAFPSWQTVNDFTMEDLTLDGNGPGNPVVASSDLDTYSRYGVRIFPGARITVQRCRFSNQICTNTITCNGAGALSDITIVDNLFSTIGGGTVDIDHSTVYTNCDRATVSRNTFTSRSGPGCNMARTAIEIHGSHQTIEDNSIDGFFYGMNVTGYTSASSGIGSAVQRYQRNSITRVRVGFVLWR